MVQNKYNPKKNNQDRRKRPVRAKANLVYTEVKTKSKAGVEYVKYKQVIPNNPPGFNRSQRRILKAKDKKNANKTNKK